MDFGLISVGFPLGYGFGLIWLDSGLVRFGFGLISVGFGLIWFGLLHFR